MKNRWLIRSLCLRRWLTKRKISLVSCDRNSIKSQYDLLAGDEATVEQEEHEVYVYQRPPGRPYELETGELPPPGVVMPPPGLENEPPILLPLAMREWIPQVKS